MYSLFYRMNNYLSHNSIVQQLKYSFQGVLNRLENFGKSRGCGYGKHSNNNFIDFIFDMKISVPKQSIQWQMKQSKIKVK